MNNQRLVVGISGSSGAILGIRLLEALQSSPVETHLVVSDAARLTIAHETGMAVEDVLALADYHYAPGDLAAPLASGSFATGGMVVIPCSIKSLSAIANSYTSDLLARAADVTLKEGRPLLLVVREAPLHAGHIRLMQLASQAGAVIFPPVPAFYSRPHSLQQVVDSIVGRVLSRLGIENDLYYPWQGVEPTAAEADGSVPGGEDQGREAVWALAAITLATVGADGAPHAAAVSFAADEDRQNLYFFSAPGSQLSLDLQSSPQAAAIIQPEASGGLQLRGTVRRVAPGDEWEQAWQRYLVKFPFAAELQAEFERSALYAFQPARVGWIDHLRRK